MHRVYNGVHCNCVMIFLNSYIHAFEPHFEHFTEDIQHHLQRVIYSMQRATVLPLRDPAINSLLELEQV